MLPFFENHRLSQITVQEIDRYRHAKVRETERLRAAHERQDRLVAEGKLEPHDRKRLPRPLSNETINKTIVRLGQVLDLAVEYGHIPANPARGKRRKLRTAKPARSYLDTAAQIRALLDAAAELDREARVDRRHVPRRAMLATLVFGGLRLGEFLSLRWRDVDLAAGWLTVGEAKTDAGVRKVKIQPALRDALLDLKARTDPKPDAFVFGTSEGKRQSPSNVRNRTLAAAVRRANDRLEEAKEPPLPRLTPHSLRRTFASVLYALGEPPPVVMQEMGHTSPSVALAIYAQAMRRDEAENERLRELVHGSPADDPAAKGRGLDPLPKSARVGQDPGESSGSEMGGDPA